MGGSQDLSPGGGLFVFLLGIKARYKFMGLDMSSSANSAQKNKEWMKKHPILTVVIVLFFIGIIVSMFDGDSSSPSTSSSTDTPVSTPSPEQAKKDREIMSLVFAKDVIKKTLKSPSTAEFVDVKAYELSNLKDVWAVNGYVDSQNSFGAIIRSQWEVQLDYRYG